MGGKFHLKLNMNVRPIANKYHEGKVKRTLKRELKVPEIAEREANGTSWHGKIVGQRAVCICSQRKRLRVQRSSFAQWFWPWESLVVTGRG